MGNYIEAQNLPEGEKVYLKKDILGWRVVEPPTKWYHYLIVSRRNFFILMALLVIAGLFYLGFMEMSTSYRLVLSDPCHFCRFVDPTNVTIGVIK